MNDRIKKLIGEPEPIEESMNIYSRAGTKVKFLDKNGYDSQREYARKFFSKGNILTVSDIEVGSFSSTVEFEEFPGKMFNTVMFGKV